MVVMRDIEHIHRPIFIADVHVTEPTLDALIDPYIVPRDGLLYVKVLAYEMSANFFVVVDRDGTTYRFFLTTKDHDHRVEILPDVWYDTYLPVRKGDSITFRAFLLSPNSVVGLNITPKNVA
jgi:hypothetical protein